MSILTKEAARAQYFTSRDSILNQNTEKIANSIFTTDIIPCMQRGFEDTSVVVTSREATAANNADEVAMIITKVKDIFTNKGFEVSSGDSSDPNTFVISWKI